MQPDNKPNDLIKNFLTQANSYSKEINTRFKLNSIISEFDDIVNKDFNRIVSLSNIRYKDVKNGKQIGQVIQEQQEDYNHLSKNVTANDFYNNKDIKKEKDKIEKSVINNAKAKEMDLFRNKIKISIHNLPFLHRNSKPRTTTNSFLTNRFNQRTKIDFSPACTPRNINATGQYQSFSNKQPEIDKECIKNKETILRNQKRYIINLLRDDEQSIEMQLREYKNELKTIKQQADEQDIIRVVKKTNDNEIPKTFSLENINFLNYKKNEDVKEETPTKNKQNEDDNNEPIDLKKMIKYTRRGQRSRCHSELMYKSNQNFKKSESQKVLNIDPHFPNNRCNTMKLIKAEVEHCGCIDERFDEKRYRLNKFLNDDVGRFPWMTVTDKRQGSLNYSKSLSSFRHSRFSTQNTKRASTKISKTTLFKAKSSEQKMIDKFQQIYDEKKKEWDFEDSKRVRVNSVNAVEQKKTENFLTNLTVLKRKPQLFIDGYSIQRQDNEELIDLTQALGNKTFYTKKKLNLELNNFFIQKELYLNEVNKKIKEEDEKRKVLEKIENDKIIEKHKNFMKKLTIQECDNTGSIHLGENENDEYYFDEKIQRAKARDNEYDNFLQYKKELIKKLSKRVDRNQSKDNNEHNIMITSQRNKLNGLNIKSNSMKIFNQDNEVPCKTKKRAYSLKIISNQKDNELFKCN